MGLQQDPGKPFPPSFLGGCLWISLAKFLSVVLWVWEGHGSTAPQTGTFHSFLVSCQTPGLAGPRELVSALWISTGLSRHRASGLASYQLFGDPNKRQSEHPLPECPLLKNGGAVCGICFCFLPSRWSFRPC